MPSHQVRKHLDKGTNAGDREDEEYRPRKRRCVVPEHHKEREPEASTPRAREKAVERTKEAVVLRVRDCVTHELRNAVVAEETDQAEGGKRHQDVVAHRNITIQVTVLIEPEDSLEEDGGEEKGEHDVPEGRFERCHAKSVPSGNGT